MRKLAFAIAGLLLLGPMSAFAAEDTANVKLVKEFISKWSEPAKASEYLSDKAVVRMEEDKPAVTGRQPFIDAWNGYFKTGASITVKTVDTYARGPVVVTQRVDTLITKGKPDQPFKVVGVFVIKDGKIVEWTDYLEK
jgi:limonene-1,2-epoxide hydrolase